MTGNPGRMDLAAAAGLLAWRGTAALAAPGLRLLLRHRAGRGKEVPARLMERRGIDATPRPPGRLLWLHAASVGEATSILPVLDQLRRRAPDLHVLLTTGTTTSARLLERRLPELGLDQVLHRFAPWDVPRWVGRFLDHWRPDAAGLVESELWPNTVMAAHARGVPLMLLNARLSPRSAARWQRVPGMARRLLGCFRLVQAQSRADAERLERLGAPEVSAPGDLKFAAPPLPADQAELDRLRVLLADRPAWLAASTHPREEVVAAEVHRTLAPQHPGLLTVVAPRHPERGPAIAKELGDAPRRAAGQEPPGEGGFWVADTLGELGLLYRLLPVVFVGKSLVGRGGQNPLEPARLGCAVAVGPHTSNFELAVDVLGRAGALHRVQDAASLADWVDRMLRDPKARREAGEAGQTRLACAADLPDRTAAALLSLLPGVWETVPGEEWADSRADAVGSEAGKAARAATGEPPGKMSGTAPAGTRDR